MPALASVSDPELKPADFRLFQQLIYREAGIRLPESKVGLVRSRLRGRVQERCGGDYHAYHDLVLRPGEGDELQRCIDALTTNETFFFRHKQHWDHICATVLPQWLAQRPPGRAFRAWCAACSTGEEPYSLAIACVDGFCGRDARVEIEASDINTTVVDRARQARYGRYALQKVTEACRRAYFVADDAEHFQVAPAVRAVVRFGQHNLQQPRSGGPYDLVLLRNVMIYFDEAMKARVLTHVTASLRPGGYLYLGGAETLSACQAAYDVVRPTIYRKRVS